MTQYNSPHEIRDDEKLEEMIKYLESGKNLPPILVHGVDAYSGSHRLEAWNVMDMEPEIEEITDDEYIDIMENLGLDSMYDNVTEFEDFLDMARELGYIKYAK